MRGFLIILACARVCYTLSCTVLFSPMNQPIALSRAVADLKASVQEVEHAMKELKQAQAAYAAAVRTATHSSSRGSVRARS